jgi:hypothetical protein
MQARLEAERTADGFRSTLREWAAECTNNLHEGDVMALAHGINGEVETEYRRGRRLVRGAWRDGA